MKTFQFVKLELRVWKKVAFGNIKSSRKAELEDLMLKKEVHWRQKARDCNSKFFHRMANSRRIKKFNRSLAKEA
ncbi:hypothetical protein AAG906_017849 [Vitis piasezkii]|uniref:Uncharacterized protein n=1 Tax=Vitis vinifera TaxID=29760 RepID=A0A438IJH7_VITVI|nr:hypothetical protein CK203_026090 [Vitis vinifera]